MDREKITDAIEVIQDKINDIGFKGQNEYDLHLREEIADYIESLLCGPSDAEWFAAMEQMLAEEAKEAADSKLFLDELEKIVSKEMFDDISFMLTESTYTFEYKIVDKPIGEFQLEDGCMTMIGMYVNQTTDGGMTGDEYAGTCSIKIGENEYFQFGYSM